jgi:NADH:ubiquinone oxidoreductase subunit 3 (subunit A)
MELLNMFSNLAPISNNGYRQQLYTDPGILQGIEFLQNENKVKKEVEQNLDLNLISDLHGTESTIVHSADSFKEGMDTQETQEKKYDALKTQYNYVLSTYNKAINEFQINYDGNVAPSPSSDAAKLERAEKFKTLNKLSQDLNNIASQLVNSVKENTTADFRSYSNMQYEIDKIQNRIVKVYTEMQENKRKHPYDITTSLAKEEETALLTKQRYYVYIIWFIILAIVLYVTITNLVDTESSFTVLLVSLVLLALLFLYLIYSSWNVEWYDFKYKLKNLNLSLPDIPKIDFNPLLSIKYTS